MQVGRMVDRLVPTTLSIFVRFDHPRLAFVHEALVETHFCIKARSYHTMAFTLYTQPTLPGISHYNLLTSTSNIQSYIHKSLFPQNRYQSSWPTTKAEQQKILHKTCSTHPAVKRILVHDYTSQRQDVLGMIPLLCGLDSSGILAKRAKTSMRVRVDRGWWMDVDWRAQYGARTETMEKRGNFYATAVSWVMLEQSFIFESIAPSRYAMFSAHFR